MVLVTVAIYTVLENDTGLTGPMLVVHDALHQGRGRNLGLIEAL